MKVFVYDQDLLVKERLERIVGDSGYEVVVQRGDQELVNVILKHRPHILLMNKNCPDFAGICTQFAQSDTYTPAIIALGDKAGCTPELFKMGVVNYLIPPFGKDELTQALVRATKINYAQECTLSGETDTSEKRTRQYIAARTHRGVELIAMSDVYYFTADQKYIKVRHKGGIVLIDEALKDLEKEFEGVMFRIHRNALINLDYLDLLESADAGQYRVRFRGVDETLAVSRRHLPALREKINKI